MVLGMGGTGSGTALLQELVKVFPAKSPERAPELRIEVVTPSLGTSGALKALASGRIELALLARLPKKEEQCAGLVVTPWAQTPVVLATSTGVREAGFSPRSLVEVLTGKASQWEDGAPIRLVLRLANESDILALAALSSDVKNALNAALSNPATVKAETDQEAVQLLERTTGSFGPTTLGLLKLSDSVLHPFSFNGIKPSVAAMTSGQYPLSKTLYLAYREPLSPAARPFVDWLRSPGMKKQLLELEHHAIFP
jgi:phosphate transport system substrate-binding protein